MLSKRIQVSLYLDEKVIKQAKQICLDQDIKRLNQFYEQAILDAVAKATEGQIELKL